MRLTASDFVSLYRPTPCPLQVYLRQQGVEESELREFGKVLQHLADCKQTVFPQDITVMRFRGEQ